MSSLSGSVKGFCSTHVTLKFTDMVSACCREKVLRVYPLKAVFVFVCLFQTRFSVLEESGKRNRIMRTALFRLLYLKAPQCRRALLLQETMKRSLFNINRWIPKAIPTNFKTPQSQRKKNYRNRRQETLVAHR